MENSPHLSEETRNALMISMLTRHSKRVTLRSVSCALMMDDQEKASAIDQTNVEDVNALALDPAESSEYVSVFERYITLKPIVAFGLTLQSAWEAIAITFGSALINGGPSSLIYGMLVVTVGSSAVAASLGELAAIDPAVGAQYRWAARYAPKSLRPHFWGFMQGWLTLLAWVASCALTPFSIALIIQSLTEFNYPTTYDPKRWHLTLIAWGFIALPIICNFWARRIFVALELIGGIMHFLVFLGFVIVLAVLMPQSPNSFVWNTVLTHQPASVPPAEPVFGWSNAGAAVCVGLLAPALAVGGFDGIIHMSGETQDAPRRVPKAMVLTVLINGLVAWFFIIALLYCFGDATTWSQPSNLPIINILYQATNSRASVNAMMSFLLLVVIIGDFSIFASVSRLAWAFARDGGLPFSETFSKVHPTLKVPIHALYLIGILDALLLLINIGSTTAFYAVVSLATLSLFISYLLPLLFLILRKLKGDGPQGPWQLGRLGILVNIFAVCYSLFMITWLPFPTALPINENTMNYAAPVWVGIVLFALLDYTISGKTRFKLKD